MQKAVYAVVREARLLSAVSQLRTVVSKHAKLLTKTQREKAPRTSTGLGHLAHAHFFWQVDDFLKNPLQSRRSAWHPLMHLVEVPEGRQWVSLCTAKLGNADPEVH